MMKPLASLLKCYARTNIMGAEGTDEFSTARNSCWNYLESTGRTYDYDSRKPLACVRVNGN
jgi:hypothetical protein